MDLLDIFQMTNLQVFTSQIISKGLRIMYRLQMEAGTSKNILHLTGETNFLMVNHVYTQLGSNFNADPAGQWLLRNSSEIDYA